MSIGVCILAGGEATRLPGKLALAVGDEPMLLRVYRNVSPGRETWISTKGALPPEIDRALVAPAVVDRWTRRGPLAGLVTTLGAMTTPWVFAVAGDAPLITAGFIDELAAQAGDDVDAVVPRHGDDARRVEPLAALYRREAFVREGFEVLRAGEGALRLVLDRLRTRFVPVADARIFTNVNTPADYDALLGSLA